MDVYYDNQLVSARLEKQVLDVTEEYVDLTTTEVGVAQTILVDFYFPSNTLTVKSRPNKDVVEICGLTT